ncbi:hypothetical protein ACRASX_16370 (plasmid) [Flavobacterium sp. TMP13]|uniref:hypothetical protein n=1 Tax=Flavobacterium sp. TMP13 TaxID=3425950 RepID=UPI003D771526
MRKIILRFGSLNNVVKWSLILSVFYIVIYKIDFETFRTLNSIPLIFSELFEKLSYAIIFSTTFYFINQHLPKENKKVKVALLLQWEIKILERDVTNFLSALGLSSAIQDPVSIKEIKKLLDIQARKMGSPINCQNTNLYFRSHIDYFQYIFIKMKENINEIIKYSEYFDENILDYLLRMNVAIDVYKSSLAPTHKSNNVSWHSFEIYAIAFNMLNLRKQFDKKYLVYLKQVNPYYKTGDTNKITGIV